jgi:DNA polymerase
VLAEARELAAGAESLMALKSALEGFNGCPLKKTARSLVFMDGVASAPILIIGDHPRKEDDDMGQPFAGEAGSLLDRMLAAIGLSRQTDVQLMNAVFWRPPGDRAPTRAELAICQPFLARAITLAQPKLLLLMGQAAADAVLGANDGLMKLRGRKHRYGEREFTQPLNAMVTPHPAYLLKRPQDKRLAWEDLLAFKEAIKALNLAPLDLP